MSKRTWHQSDDPLVSVVPAHAWVGETIEPVVKTPEPLQPGQHMRMVDADGNVLMTIYAGAHPVKINRLGADMVFEWKPAAKKVDEQ